MLCIIHILSHPYAIRCINIKKNILLDFCLPKTKYISCERPSLKLDFFKSLLISTPLNILYYTTKMARSIGSGVFPGRDWIRHFTLCIGTNSRGRKNRRETGLIPVLRCKPAKYTKIIVVIITIMSISGNVLIFQKCSNNFTDSV